MEKNAEKKITILDIARLANVSPSSVSRVVNGIPGVKPATRKLVMNIISETGYQPNTLASGLSKGKINIVGLILGDVRNPFYSDMTYYVQKSLQQAGYQAMLFDSEYNSKVELECLALSKQLGFSGVIMITAMDSQELKRTIDSLSFPVILLNRTIENFDGSFVILDNFQAGYIITKHLIELGHPSIGFLAGPKNSTSSSLRVQGYKQALVNYAIPYKDEYVIQGDLTMEKGYRVACNLIPRLDSFPSAIICGNDLMAIGFLNACHEHGVPVPERISVAGFDDINISSLLGIELTTIRQPSSEMGMKAAELMLAKIQDKDAPNQRIILDPELILRKTTAPFTKR